MKTSTPLVALQSFIAATRDSGYKSLGSAIAELIDNALEASATRVEVNFNENRSESGQRAIVVSVTDNGIGMAPGVLRLALQFGGSTRFGSRNGTGRYGMGLPNGGLSYAKRVEVLTWTDPSRIWMTYLDADEIATGHLRVVPTPKPVAPSRVKPRTKTGTIVRLSKCDRLDHRPLSAIERDLSGELGRTFRKPLYAGRRIDLNETRIQPIDPLFLDTGANMTGATLYGPPLVFNVRIPTPVPSHLPVSTVSVRFSELPVESWHRLSNEEKNELGIAKNAGVSIVRAGREIDYGWYFMGTKRKENYDDWWRCEVAFSPELDELFGVTHSKQKINPSELLNSMIVPDMERIARELNSRVRTKYAWLRATTKDGATVRRLQERDYLLEPPKLVGAKGKRKLAAPALLRKRNNGLYGLRFAVKHELSDENQFYSPLLRDGELSLVFNKAHPFYDRVYNRLASSQDGKDKNALQCVLLLLVSGARAECMLSRAKEREIMTRFREIWGDTIAAFLS